MSFKAGDRVSFYDPAGKIVSDVVTAVSTKTVGYAAYEKVRTIPVLMLAHYGWVPEIGIIM